MKSVLVMACLLLCGCAAMTKRYQVVILDSSSAQINRLEPQNRADAEKKALAITLAAQGQAVAWVQKKQPVSNAPHLQLPKVKSTQQ